MRPALALLALLLLAPTVLAQAPATPPRGTIWTVMNTVEATVQGNYAVVNVIADIGNRGPDPEFPFLVRVPDDAFVTGLTIERDGQVFEARIEERAKARTEYEAHKAAQQTGGLVEKQRHSQLYAYLINVAEFTSVRATLTYERYLAADRGVYNLSLEAPVSGFGQDLGAQFRVRVLGSDVTAAWGDQGGAAQRTQDGYEVTWSVGPRGSDAATPFQASYTLASTTDAGELLTTTREGVGYFVHRFRAPSEVPCDGPVIPTVSNCVVTREMPVDLVLVLDISGSMGGLKMQQMQDAAAQVIQQLGPEDRLHLAFFSSDSTAPWTGLRSMTPENRRLAADEVRNAFVAGGTNLEAALRAGFRGLDGDGRACDASSSSAGGCGIDWREEEGRLPALVVLTDGQPTVGVTDRAQLRQMARDANQHNVNVFAIAFGADADWSFVHGIAADGNGVALRVPEGQGAEVDIRRFMQLLTTPVLKDVRAQYPAHANASRSGAPILFAGSELLVVGTFDPAKGPLRATVTARAPDGERSYQVEARDASLPFLPRVVAYHGIQRLQDLIMAEGARPEWVAEVTRLGLQHGYVTDYTSLVVTLEPRAGCDGCTFSPTVVNDAGSDADGRVTLDTTAGRSAWSTSGNGLASGSPAPTATTTAEMRAYEGGQAAPTPRVPGPAPVLVLAVLALAAVLLRRKR